MAECDHLFRHCKLVLHITYAHVGWPCLQIEVQVVACISFSLPLLNFGGLGDRLSAFVNDLRIPFVYCNAPHLKTFIRTQESGGTREPVCLCVVPLSSQMFLHSLEL